MCPPGRSDRDVRHRADRRRGLVRQDPAGRAQGHGQRDGAEGAAQELHGRPGLLPGVPFQLPPEQPPEHRVHVRRGLPDGRFLRVRAGVRAAGRPHVEHIRQRHRRVAQQKRRPTGTGDTWLAGWPVGRGWDNYRFWGGGEIHIVKTTVVGDTEIGPRAPRLAILTLPYAHGFSTCTF